MKRMIPRARLVARAFGWRGLARRVLYMGMLHSGVLSRRLPTARTFDRSPPLSWRYRFDLTSIRRSYETAGIADEVRPHVVDEAERFVAGQLRLYGWRWFEVGSPPRWHVNPFTEHEYPKAHWTGISDDDPDRGDVKDVWEISRLPFTFTLARAYVLTGDAHWVESWWRTVENWAIENPPNTGVNWRCGQETSLRGIALCFGLSTFGDHPSTTPDRRELAGRLLGASVERVRPTVGYALSQRNNHAISELVFLLSVRAPGERRHLQLIIEVLDDQFYADGSYSQQSFSYQRMAVQTLQWLLITRPDLPPEVRQRIVDVLARSRDFLTRCSDPVSGCLPNYGPNDGAMLFPLSTAHHRDFRPLLCSLGYDGGGPSLHEPAAWLAMAEVTACRTALDREATTYQTLRGPRSLALSRIGREGHRPGHSDQQAIDLWIEGQNVVSDPGTYRYTAPAPWRNALTGPEVHSSASVPGEVGASLGRFLAEGTAPARLVHRSATASGEILISERSCGGGSLWRVVLRHDDAFTIIDVSNGVDAVVRWNFPSPGAVWVSASPPLTAVGPPFDDDPRSGWSSPLYGFREPIAAYDVSLPAGRGTALHVSAIPRPQVTTAELRSQFADILPREVLVAAIDAFDRQRSASPAQLPSPGSAPSRSIESGAT